MQRITPASVEKSFHLIGLLCKTRIFRPAVRVLLANGLLALKAPVISSYLLLASLNYTDFLGIFHIQPVALCFPRIDKE